VLFCGLNLGKSWAKRQQQQQQQQPEHTTFSNSDVLLPCLCCSPCAARVASCLLGRPHAPSWNPARSLSVGRGGRGNKWPPESSQDSLHSADSLYLDSLWAAPRRAASVACLALEGCPSSRAQLRPELQWPPPVLIIQLCRDLCPIGRRRTLNCGSQGAQVSPRRPN